MKKSSCWIVALGLLAACAAEEESTWSAEDGATLELAEGDEDAEIEPAERETAHAETTEGEATEWGSAQQALCAAGAPDCEDWEGRAIVVIEDDGRQLLGTYTGGNKCIGFEHPDFRGASLSLDRNFIFTFVGSRMNDKISSFRVAAGCEIIGFRDPDQRGVQTRYHSDAAYVGDTENDKVSSYECRCR